MTWASGCAREPPQRAPTIGCEACPILARERPAPQAGIARDGVVPVDAAQDRVFELGVGELLRRAGKLLGADALAQLIAADACRPGNVPDPCGLVAGGRQNPAAIRAERRRVDSAAVSS